jgi:hypothetical protein
MHDLTIKYLYFSGGGAVDPWTLHSAAHCGREVFTISEQRSKGETLRSAQKYTEGQRKTDTDVYMLKASQVDEGAIHPAG